MNVLATASEVFSQFVAELRRVLSRERVLTVRESQNQSVCSSFSAGRFLDQPPGDGFLYPQGMSSETS